MRQPRDPRPFVWTSFIDKFIMKLSYHCSYQSARQHLMLILLFTDGLVELAVAGSLYGELSPHKKRESGVWINTVLVFTTENSAADEPCRRWLCREMWRRRETKGERRRWIMARLGFTVFHPSRKDFSQGAVNATSLSQSTQTHTHTHLFNFYADTNLLCAFFWTLRLSNTVECNIQSTFSVWGNTPSVLF